MDIDIVSKLYLMNMPEWTASINCLRRLEEETFKGTRLKREPGLFWVTPDSVIRLITLL